jgi:signal transduction histidine kinase
VTLAGVATLGWLVSRILARALTDPITRLQSATARIGAQVDVAGITELLASGRKAKDELGQLAEAYLAMARRIETYLKEIEALDTIGQEINTIGPDDLDGALRRITDRAAELMHTDLCLVLLRDARGSCWSVEAASGEWNDRLKNAVTPWEGLPVSVQAFQARGVVTGEWLHPAEWLKTVRRNPARGSVLAVPLLADGVSFGVLSFVSDRPRGAHEWNQRLAEGLAQEVALGILNARVQEATQRKQRGLVTRLRQLEHLAETLAHDLKGPGARMEELARLLVKQDRGQFDARTKRWLSLLEENGRELVQRVEGILSVARVGAEPGVITAVDPAEIIGEVVKDRAGDIDRLRAVIGVEPSLPLVACHGAHLRQVFDNLISNALKFARGGQSPVVRISARIHDQSVAFAVEDNGIGIPVSQRTRVFEPFVRLLESDAPGSGIGLTIAQRIVELYGGRVWIDGAEGSGCTVRFTVPTFREQESKWPDRLQPSRPFDPVDVDRRGAL